MAYFISNQDSTKEKDPNINIINDIHNIERKTSVNILMSNYTNKCITFNKGEYIGHLDSMIMERMMAEKVKPDTFKPPNHKLKQNIKTKLIEQLKEYDSQFAQHETSIGTTPLTEMTIVKVQNIDVWLVYSPMLIPRQLRFSLYSGAVITEGLM